MHAPKRSFTTFALAIGAAMCFTSAAHAGFGRDLLVGLSYLAGVSAPSAERNGYLVLSDEPIPDGWRLTWGRSFGPDAFNRPDAIELGGARLILTNGQAEIQAQQITRGLDGARLFVSTPEPISYQFELNTGVQDVLTVGTFAMRENAYINELGFYDFELNASNRGTRQIDGFVLVDEQTLDFDVGPINISGNVYVDALSAVVEPLFDGLGIENPFAKFSGRATKEALVNDPVEAIRAKIEAGEKVTEEEIQTLAEATILATIFRVPVPDLTFLEDLEDDQLILNDTDATVDTTDGALAVAPEPATITFMVFSTAAACFFRRRRKV